MTRRLLVLAAVMVAVAGVLVVRRPWERPAAGPANNPQPAGITAADVAKLNPASMVTLRCVIAGGGDCGLTIMGSNGDNIDRTMFNLKVGIPQETLKIAPFTIKSITLERDGKKHTQNTNMTIPPGQKRELRVRADDSVEIVELPK
jgi:hypothetical protein